jgi:hypothetical protein
MNAQWQYQLRIYLAEHFAELARRDRKTAELQPLTDILTKQGATLVNQLDAFENYVLEAEREGPEHFPLYKWTKATLDDPARRRKHMTTFALHVAGNEVYARETADALEASLQDLVGGNLVTRLSRHDTNPASNLRVPDKYRQ